ncbi:competence type IV pilus assembly protein ComGB [Neobacillus sp. PS3-40]|uniref:competence type IV pilus assembly protein ComGB n=1 Tax=Neobacillus sp. PS3-40 TaxID=3070679 RepID=UPI0027DF6DCD|nr:competence type IV pilus assembly protein ComGB [Neobacillus sp. PS3-40]WML45290.1 competence type IV pilus assembly protein ComGB [Neobacillus sp. PS3-40]
MNGLFMMKKHRSWPIIEQVHFLRRMGELLVRGYPIAAAIESLSIQMKPTRKKELKECLIDLKKGLSFHDGLANLGFHEDLVGYVFFAEQHGSFAEALLEGSSLVLKKDQDKQKLVKLLQYPTLLIFITGFLFIFVEKTLLPRFTTLFKTMNLEENLFTKIVYAFGRFFPLLLIILIITLSLTAIYYFMFFRKASILQQKIKLVRIPLLGHILKLMYTHYFSVQLSFLLTGGLSVSEALRIFESYQKQPFYSRIGKEVRLKLVTGDKFESIIKIFPFFEKEFATIVKHGQENGKLEQELYFYSRHCITSVEEIIEKSLKVIQPILYLFIGILVVSMYLAILLPMFHLMDGI